jgi:hypothetical protein
MATSRVIIGSTIGITFSALFVGGNCAITYIGLPALLLPSQSSQQPSPENSTPTKAPLSTSASKPGTPSPHIARQWQIIYNIGSKLGPAVALISSAAYIFTMLQLPKSFVAQRRLFIAAAALAVMVGPFTFVVMQRTNSELHRRANLATQGIEEGDEMLKKKALGVGQYETTDLLRRWGVLNVIRASFPLMAIGAAATALVL